MVVAMMNVWQVSMGVHHGGVTMAVDVAALYDIVLMTVMPIVMGVVVLMNHERMLMVVLVTASKNEPNADQSNDQRQHLATSDRLAKHHPRCDRANERCGSEHQLPSGRTDFASTGNPHRDRCPISDRPDEQRTGDRPARGPLSGREPDEQIHATGNGAFGERDVHGSEFIEFGSHPVIDRPTKAGPHAGSRSDLMPRVAVDHGHNCLIPADGLCVHRLTNTSRSSIEGKLERFTKGPPKIPQPLVSHSLLT
jgi:hypothetical protein